MQVLRALAAWRRFAAPVENSLPLRLVCWRVFYRRQSIGPGGAVTESVEVRMLALWKPSAECVRLFLAVQNQQRKDGRNL